MRSTSSARQIATIAATGRRKILPLLIGTALTTTIFFLDTISSLHIAVAATYVVVILIAAIYFQRRGVVLVSAAAFVLTVTSYVLIHGFELDGTAYLRALVSLAAILITAWLALMNQTANARLRATERERANLARFFSPQMIDHLVEVDAPFSIARYQPAAILFVDMVGFVTYSSTKTPDAVIAFLRDLLSLLGDSVFANDGIIDKFLGDGLMAVFGPPLPGPADATNAARCAFNILRAVDLWNENSHRTGADAVQVAVGIHFGDVVQGDVGNDKRLELTVVGDAVNIASRVEGYCRELGAALLVTGDFVDALYAEGSEDLAGRFRDQGHHILQGRSESIHLYGFKRPATKAAAAVPYADSANMTDSSVA